MSGEVIKKIIIKRAAELGRLFQFTIGRPPAGKYFKIRQSILIYIKNSENNNAS